MAISPLGAGSSRGNDLVALFNTHTALHEQRAAPGPPPMPDYGAGAPSRALAAPTWRPAFLAGASTRSREQGDGSSASRNAAFARRASQERSRCLVPLARTSRAPAWLVAA